MQLQELGRLRLERPRARLRSAFTVAVAALSVSAALGLSQPKSAAAYSLDYCGIVVASGATWPCQSPRHWFSYASTSYSGGSLSDIEVRLYDTSSHIDYMGALNSGFISTCWPGSGGYDSSGQGQFWASNGANHTLYGHADDSPNHTGC